MAQYVGDRRYRLNGDEILVVLELVRFKLLELVASKEDLEVARTLFRVLYRHEAYQPGRPDYPDPLEWSTIEAFVRDIGPFLPEDIGPLIDEEDSTEEKKGESG